ncbi:MAG: flagellin lysine-N-methylase [Mycobacterium leprae]
MGNPAMRRVLMPTYLTRFVCDGQQCEDTCCAGWRVDLDRATYKKYQKVREPALRNSLDDVVKRNRDNSSDASYARIQLNADGVCPLLTSDRLCAIQLSLGFDHLSDTCAIYPRFTNEVDGVHQRGATLSCPTIARLALLEPGGITFEATIEPVTVRAQSRRTVNTQSAAVADKIERYLPELQSFAIDLLQNRSYSLAERLIILGMFIQKLEQQNAGGQASATPQLIDKYVAMAADGALKTELSQIKAQPTFQVVLLKDLVGVRASLGTRNTRYTECLTECLLGLECTEEESVEELTEHYREGYDQFYQPFMASHEYMLENYLVNRAFVHLFPLGVKGMGGPFVEYMLLVVHYALIKMHLIGMSRYHRGLTEELVVKLVQSLVKEFEHTPSFAVRCLNALVEKDLGSMAAMAMLIQD